MKEINVAGQKRTDLGKKASKAKKRETVQASRAYTPKKGTFQRIREGVQRVASAAGNAIRRRLH